MPEIVVMEHIRSDPMTWVRGMGPVEQGFEKAAKQRERHSGSGWPETRAWIRADVGKRLAGEIDEIRHSAMGGRTGKEGNEGCEMKEIHKCAIACESNPRTTIHMRPTVPIIFGVKTSPPEPVSPLEDPNCAKQPKVKQYREIGCKRTGQSCALYTAPIAPETARDARRNHSITSVRSDVMATGTYASRSNSFEVRANAVSRVSPSLSRDSAELAIERGGMRLSRVGPRPPSAKSGIKIFPPVQLQRRVYVSVFLCRGTVTCHQGSGCVEFVARDGTRHDARASRPSTRRSVPVSLGLSPGTCPIFGLKNPESRVYAQNLGCWNMSVQHHFASHPDSDVNSVKRHLATRVPNFAPRRRIDVPRTALHDWQTPPTTTMRRLSHSNSFTGVVSVLRWGGVRGADNAETIFRPPASKVSLLANPTRQAHCSVSTPPLRHLALASGDGSAAQRRRAETHFAPALPFTSPPQPRRAPFQKFDICASGERHLGTSQPSLVGEAPKSNFDFWASRERGCQHWGSRSFVALCSDEIEQKIGPAARSPIFLQTSPAAHSRCKTLTLVRSEQAQFKRVQQHAEMLTLLWSVTLLTLGSQ
ncbi:hypothetical protein DFH06DRAFT_1135532 [Mycena polygramma]|nr:hypothetical protein DFH06DRAFT_1135532 [Mycena polygramma]